MMDVDNELEAKAAFAHALAATVYAVPDGALVEAAFDEAGALRNPPWPSSPSIARGVDLLGAMAHAPSSDRENLVGELVADHFSLVEGAGIPLAPPWESLYFRGDDCLFGTQTLQVRALYESCGLAIEGRGSEPDDHLGLELSFAAFLLDSLAAGEDPASQAFCRDTLRELLEGHLLLWADRWCRLVRGHARTDFYRAVACLVQGAVSSLGDDLGCRRSASRIQVPSGPDGSDLSAI